MHSAHSGRRSPGHNRRRLGNITIIEIIAIHKTAPRGTVEELEEMEEIEELDEIKSPFLPLKHAL